MSRKYYDTLEKNYYGQLELTSEEAKRARAANLPVTERPVFPSLSGLETRFPSTPDLEPTKWAKLTRVETKAKAVADKLKECDKMQAEIDDLTRYKNYIALIRKQQQEGWLPANCLLPPYPSKEERTSKEERKSKRRTHSAHGGRRRKIRRRKTKRAKKLNKTK
jgi:hypothetical protein